LAYKIVYTKQAVKDIENIKTAKLDGVVKRLIRILEENPYETPPTFEKLKGELDGAYSRRINYKHRLVYQVYPKQNTVKIIRMWTHYE